MENKPSQEDEFPFETDSVDAQFGGEYSEDTLNLVKSYGNKPIWMEEPSSLDPIDDLDAHLEHGLRIPPRTYSAIQEAAEEEIAQIVAQKNMRLDPDQEQLIDYRRRLVEGTSLDDIKILKLRAYHRAMDRLKAENAELNKPEVRRQLMEMYGVPLDKVPQDLIDMTPDQIADRWQRIQRAKQGGKVAAVADYSGYSDDSEWAHDWDSRSYLLSDASRRAFQQAFAPSEVSVAPLEPASGSHPDWGEFGQILLAGDPDKAQVWAPVRKYTPEFLNQQRLSRQLRAQQRQRALAFWVPLITILGTYAVKGIKRVLLNRRRRDGSAGQPRPSPANKSIQQ